MNQRRSALSTVGPLGGLCVVVCLQASAMAQGIASTKYVVRSWVPAQSTLSVASSSKPMGDAASANLVVDATQQLCLAAAQAATQTLVQIQPKEGGEARFVALGGGKPSCATVGAAWDAASPKESHWYKALFSMLKPDGSSVRVSTSTTGRGRGGPPSKNTNGPQKDPCGIWPSSKGKVQLVTGTWALTFGTNLPEGATLMWLEKGRAPASAPNAVVKQGRAELPPTEYQIGEQWSLQALMPGQAKAVQCSTTVTVLGQSASPLVALKEVAPALDSDPTVADLALMATLLADSSQGLWHAWLLAASRSGGTGTSSTSAAWGNQLEQAWWSSAEPPKQP